MKKHGKGTFVYPDGVTIYKGKFKNNLFNGKGTFFWADGSSFVGKFLNGDF
jgi:hypothetical protein